MKNDIETYWWIKEWIDYTDDGITPTTDGSN